MEAGSGDTMNNADKQPIQRMFIDIFITFRSSKKV